MPRPLANTHNISRVRSPNRITRHTEVWQLWHVLIVTFPRRSITGKPVWGTVLRRRDGNRWIYKKYVEPADLV
jgi:hypothetical protein